MKQKSESLQIMFILTLIGGFLDSYSYITRGGVFAFAQTGNLVLLSINICYGNLDKIARYIMPIIAFILGTTLVLSLIHISEPTRRLSRSRMPSSA